jgi:hypothetical protein
MDSLKGNRLLQMKIKKLKLRTDVMILKIFLPKNWQKLRFFALTTASFFAKNDHNIDPWQLPKAFDDIYSIFFLKKFQDFVTR